MGQAKVNLRWPHAAGPAPGCKAVSRATRNASIVWPAFLALPSSISPTSLSAKGGQVLEERAPRAF
jgi:hypothetical protein